MNALFHISLPGVFQPGHVAVDEIQIASGLYLNAVKVFEFLDVVGAHPAVLTGNRISAHAGLTVAAKQAFHIESREILRFLG